MYTIAKQFSFSASHVIDGVPEDHPCGRLHGHNYTVEVQLAAERGERFPEPIGDGDEGGSREAGSDEAPASSAEDPFREARSQLSVGPGEEQPFVLTCPFEPERVVVDPDALVLQLGREQAIHRW